MKQALTAAELAQMPLKFQTQVETIKAEKLSVQNQLKVNEAVENADIHELYVFYDDAFFGGRLAGKCVLEWSTKMT